MNQATTRIAVCVIAFVLAFQLDAAKAESPASTSPTPTMGEFFSGLNPMNWKMPNFKSVLPGQDETARIKEKKDGLVSDVSATASRSWQRTKDVLDPRRLSPSNWLPAQSESPQSESPGFFSSLFGGKAEAEADSERVATVGDFLAQPKITR